MINQFLCHVVCMLVVPSLPLVLLFALTAKTCEIQVCNITYAGLGVVVLSVGSVVKIFMTVALISYYCLLKV